MTQNATTAVTKPAAAARKTIFDLIQSQKEQVALALPKHLSPDRMIRVMTTSLRMTPKLQQCTAESLLGCLMKCSQYGLEPDGRHAHLIPYGEISTLVFDYKGLVALVRRSGEILDIHCDVVREGDDFEFCYGSGGVLRHKPNFKSKERGAVYAAYSFVKLKDGSESYEVLTIGEVEAIRDNSQGFKAAKKYGKQSPWDDFPDEMAKKTAFRRHSKWLPLSFELKEAISADDDKESEQRRFESAKPIYSNIAQLTQPEEPVTEIALEPATAPEADPGEQPATQTPPPATDPAKDDPVKAVETDFATLRKHLEAAQIKPEQFILWVRLANYVSPIADLDEIKNSPKKLSWLIKNWEVKKYAEQIRVAREAA